MTVSYRRLIDIISIVCIAVFFIFLYTNMFYFSVPNSDIFQYIEDGRTYLDLKLPKSIQVPPAFSILISLGAMVFHAVKTPEIFSAHVINILSSISILICVYILIRKYEQTLGLLVILLLITNPHFVFSSLDVNTEVLFTALTVGAFVAFQRNQLKLAHGIAGISFLVRYEAVLLVLSIITCSFSIPRSRREKLHQNLLATIPVIVWIVLSAFRNHTVSVLGNEYIQEVIDQIHRLPQFGILSEFYRILADFLDTKTRGSILHIIGTFFLYTFIGIGWIFNSTTIHKSIRLAYLFASLYIFFHLLFPYAPDRYIIPVLWCLYFAALIGLLHMTEIFKKQYPLVTHIVRTIIYGGAVLLIYLNFLRTAGYYSKTQIIGTAYPKFYRHEVLLASNWLNSQVFKKPVIVITYEPWILRYYTVNRAVSYPFFGYDNYRACNSISCLIETYIHPTEKQQIFFIQQSNSLLINDTFPSASNFNVQIFNHFPNESEKNKFLLIKQMSFLDSWAKIYTYIPITQR